MLRPSLLAVGVATAIASSLPAVAQPAGRTPQPEIDDVISVTGARRREEAVQEVPIPVSVVDGELITEAGAFNVNRIKELIPSVQLYSSNPRNTGVNIRGDIYYRDDFSSSPTPSQYLNIEAYSLLNLRVGFRSDNGWSGFLWVRNSLDEEYFEQLLAAPAGNGAGHYGAVLGDPVAYGATLRFSF
jgi:outer membrane receptor protein involved in Fe transport